MNDKLGSLLSVKQKTMKLLKGFMVIFLLQVHSNRCDNLKFKYQSDYLRVDKKNLMCTAIESLSDFPQISQASAIDFIFATHDDEILSCFKSLIGKKDCTVSIIATSSKRKSTKQFPRRKKYFIVIVLDSASSIPNVLSSETLEQFNSNGKILLFFPQMSYTGVQLDEVFNFFWKRFFYNVNILVTNKLSMEMFTFFPFSANGKCHDTKSQKINEFKDGKWLMTAFFPEKLRNFHGCTLKAACLEFEPSAHKTVSSNGTVTINGSDVEILNGLADILNIDLKIDVIKVNGASWSTVYRNGSATGNFKPLIDGEIDIAASLFYLTELWSQFLQFTSAYFNLQMVLMIPPSAPFSPLETLLRPFDFIVWIALISFILMAFIAVLIIKLLSRQSQVLFFDRNINSPIMEIFAIIFGISQHALPRKSFSRILLMSFAMFSLVVRSVYTGSLFKFLQSDGHKKDFDTISQLLEENFDFFIDPGIEAMMEHTEFYERYEHKNEKKFSSD